MLLSEVFPPQTGGSGRWLFELYRRMPAGSVAVAAGEYAGCEAFDREQALPIERLPLTFPTWGCMSQQGAGHYWRALGKLMRMVRQQRPTAVHCGKILPEGWLAWMLRLRLRLPYVLFVHGEEMCIAADSRELAWMARRVLSGAKQVIANSHNTARILREEWNISPERLTILHPGVDTERFKPAPRNATLRERLGWGDRPVVLTVGRLQKRKGHDMLIRALPAIRNQTPGVLYAIVGDGEERRALESLTDELGLHQHVQFRGEPSDEELIECYQQCDLFALPNREVSRDIEGFGMVLVEAQACGKAVIAGASGGTAETMLAKRTGELVSCIDPNEVASAIVRYLREPALLHRIGQEGREWALAEFDWKVLLARSYLSLGFSV